MEKHGTATIIDCAWVVYAEVIQYFWCTEYLGSMMMALSNFHGKALEYVIQIKRTTQQLLL